jgi:hypothetical protein
MKSFQRAISLMTMENPNRLCLHNLTTALEFCFHKTGSRADLERAIKNQEQALSTLPANHMERGQMFDCFGDLFKERFLITRSRKDIDLAIANGKDAVTVTPPGHSKPAMRQVKLAIELQHRFKLTAFSDDFNRTIDNFVAAADDTSVPPVTRILASSAAQLLLESNEMKAKSFARVCSRPPSSYLSENFVAPRSAIGRGSRTRCIAVD